MSRRPKIVCLSGSFDPKPLGYNCLFREAKAQAEKFVVLVKSDAWGLKNKGGFSLSEEKRKKLVESIKYVDQVVITHHKQDTQDQSDSKEIKYLNPDIFIKTTKDEIPEKEACEKISCEIKRISLTPRIPTGIFRLLKYLFYKLFSKSPKKERKEKEKEKRKKLFIKFKGNPILEPSENSWESQATFNAATFEDNGGIHILYRAIGHDNRSVLGYAYSNDGVNINYKHPFPAYDPENANGTEIATKEKLNFHSYISGGGWKGGAEDPRLTVIGSEVFMTYTSFNGASLPHIELTYIKKEDFLNHNWNWAKPRQISPKGEIHKNWVIFPRKINGKYAILHSISPEILISYVDDLKDDKNYPIRSFYDGNGMGRENYWDSWVRGAGPPPIRTKEGWLLFYHAMETSHSRNYNIGAFLLNLNDPTKIIARSSSPLITPEKDYEDIRGFKPGVVYSCGAGVLDDKLFLYYGGADTFLCTAYTNLESFIRKLKKRDKPKLKTEKSEYV